MERLGERYVIRRVLGRGGMGEVYEALDLRLGRSVAIKVLTDAGSTQGSERLLREARAAAAFEHPNAVTVFDVGSSRSQPAQTALSPIDPAPAQAPPRPPSPLPHAARRR